MVYDLSYFSLLSSGSWVRIPPGTQYSPLVEWFTIPPCHGARCGFESRTDCKFIDIYGEAAKFQTKLIKIIEVDLTVHLIETIIDM